MPIGAFKLNSISKYSAAAVAVDTNKSILLRGGTSNDGYIANTVTNNITANKTLTLSLWWKPSDSTVRGVLFGAATASVGGQNAVFFENTAAREFRLYSYTNGYGVTIDIKSPAIIWSNIWNHIVVSVDLTSTTTRYMYVNGVSQTITATTYVTGQNNGLASIFKLGLGIRNWNPVDLGSAGELAQVWIDNSYIDLTNSANLSKFYNGGYVEMGTDGTQSGLSQPLIFHAGNTTSSPTFSTNKGRTSGGAGTISYSTSTSGTVSSGTSIQQVYTNGSVSLNTSTKKFGTGSGYSSAWGASNNIVIEPRAWDDTNWTIEGWFNMTTRTGDYWGVINSSGILRNAGFVAWTNNEFQMQSEALTSYSFTGATIPMNQWNHIAVVRSSTTAKVYLNGTQYGSTATVGTSTFITSGYRLRFGFGGPQSGTLFNGYIDEFRMSNNVRYSANFTPPTTEFTYDANTVALLRFNELPFTASIT